MPKERKRISEWGKALLPSRVGVFLAFFGFYLLTWVDMRLVFWNQNDLFLWSFRFARDFMVSPGHPCQWLGKLLLQLCYFGWPGALVVVTVVWVLLISAKGFFSRVDPSTRTCDTWVIPAILLVVLHSQYTFSLSATSGLALALAAGNVYVRVPCRRSWARLAIFFAGSVFLYYVAGDAYYTFAACCLVYELLAAKRRVLGLSFLLVAPAVKFGIDGALFYINLAYLHFDIPEASCLVPHQSMEERILEILYAYFPACALYIAIKPAAFARLKRQWRRGGEGEIRQNGLKPSQMEAIGTRDNRDGPQECVSQGSEPRLTGMLAIRRWVLTPILLVVVAGAGVKFSHTSSNKKILRIDYYSSNRMWDEVLWEAKSVPSRIRADYVSQDIYVALYHTGRLPYDMFSYPPSSLFVAHDFGGRGRLFSRKGYDLYLALGRVNEAESIAHNALEQHLSAELLMRIALVKMVKGQIGAARLYLNVLRDDLLYGRWARGYLERLQEDPDLAGEPEILKVRSLMIRKDDAHLVYGEAEGRSIPVSTERQLTSLLEHNPRNRMAFEYLMAIHLLRTDVEALVAQLPRVKEFPYPNTPTLYEEAAMLCAVDRTNDLVTSETGVTACGWPISEETRRRCGRLQEIISTFGGLENPMARDAVARRLGNRYLFYYFYGPNQSR